MLTHTLLMKSLVFLRAAIDPIEKWEEQERLVISLQALKRKGYRLRNADISPNSWSGNLAEKIVMEFVK